MSALLENLGEVKMTGWTADVQVCTLAGVNISDCIKASWSQPHLKEVKLERKVTVSLKQTDRETLLHPGNFKKAEV